MKIGTWELIVIILIGIFVLGPERVVLYARKLGKLLRTLKVYITSITGDLRETVVEPLQEIQEPLREIAAPLNELTTAVQQPLNELTTAVQQPLNEIQATVQQSKNEMNAAVNDLNRSLNTATSVSSKKADETKPEEPELEFAELEDAEPELEEAAGECGENIGDAVNTVQEAEPAPETHVDADIEDAGDVTPSHDEEPIVSEIGAQDTDLKT